MEADLPMKKNEIEKNEEHIEFNIKKHNIKDIDASWDGTISLDKHREMVLSQLCGQESGFGQKADSNNGK